MACRSSPLLTRSGHLPPHLSNRCGLLEVRLYLASFLNERANISHFQAATAHRQMLAPLHTCPPTSSPSLARFPLSSTPSSLSPSPFLPSTLSDRPLHPRRVTAGPALELGDQPQFAFPEGDSGTAGTSRSQGSSPIVADFARGEGEVPFAEEWRRSFGAGAKRRSGKGGDHVSLSSLRDELETGSEDQEGGSADESLFSSPPPTTLLQPSQQRKSITTASALVLDDIKSYDFGLFIAQLDHHALDVASEADLDLEAREDGTAILLPAFDEFGHAEDDGGGMGEIDEEAWREAARAGEQLELDEGRTFVFPPIASTSSLFPPAADRKSVV